MIMDDAAARAAENQADLCVRGSVIIDEKQWYVRHVLYHVIVCVMCLIYIFQFEN